MKRLTNPKVQKAIAEIERLIRARYPEATFEAFADRETGHICVYTWVNTDDDWAVVDLVSDYLSDILVHEDIPMLVFPRLAPARAS